MLDVIRDAAVAPPARARSRARSRTCSRDKQLALLLLVGGLAATARPDVPVPAAFRRAARPLHAATRRACSARARPAARPRPDRRGPADRLDGPVRDRHGSLAHAIGDVAGHLRRRGRVLGHRQVARAARDGVRGVRGAAAVGVQRSARARVELGRLQSGRWPRSAWAFAVTGFALYLASFGTFEDTYGTIGSGIVLLVWLTMFRCSTT